VEHFGNNIKHYLDISGELAIELRVLQERVTKEREERKKMGLNHLEDVSERDIEAAGVSKREFDLIKRMMKFDSSLFEFQEFKERFPITYTVDLTKYQGQKVPQEFKDIFFRPHKMRRLYDQYWRLASDLDKKNRDEK
jgi:hypothetical protein